MRARIGGVSLFVFAGWAIGCATPPGSRAYYDDLEGGDVATWPDATGGGDVAFSADSPASAETGTEGGEASIPADAEPNADAGTDGDAGAGTDSGTGPDAGTDAAADAPAPDDAGCGATDTPQNCTGCGLACDTSQSTGAGCNGTSCTYSGCVSGFADCDMTAPNLDGCECPSASDPSQGMVGGCCGTGCQTQHDTGMGVSYYDCAALSTYGMTEAMEACTAFTGDASQCASFGCAGSGANAVVCSSGSPTTCVCWNYSGTHVGHVYDSGSAGSCLCPGSTSTAWN